MKKKGSSLIEVIISVLLLIIIVPVIAKVNEKNIGDMEVVKVNEELNRVAYCIMQEIKYNYKIEDIKYLDDLQLKYYDAFLLDLSDEELLKFESGDNISIKFSKYREDIYNVELIISVKVGDRDIIVKRDFIKSKWMDYDQEI